MAHLCRGHSFFFQFGVHTGDQRRRHLNPRRYMSKVWILYDTLIIRIQLGTPPRSNMSATIADGYWVSLSITLYHGQKKRMIVFMTSLFTLAFFFYSSLTFYCYQYKILGYRAKNRMCYFLGWQPINVSGTNIGKLRKLQWSCD